MASECENCKYTWAWKLINWMLRSKFESGTDQRADYDDMLQENILNMRRIVLHGTVIADKFLTHSRGKKFLRMKHEWQSSSDEYNNPWFYVYGPNLGQDGTVHNKKETFGTQRDGTTIQRIYVNDVSIGRWECSSLYFAAQYRHIGMIKILLENESDPNQLDYKKSTPLHALAQLCPCECGTRNHFCGYRKPVDEIVKILVEKGANVEARNEDGDTPLSLAVRRFDFMSNVEGTSRSWR
ncbi:hypothetical protein TKK_0008464 [Trichogramma kaykai]